MDHLTARTQPGTRIASIGRPLVTDASRSGLQLIRQVGIVVSWTRVTHGAFQADWESRAQLEKIFSFRVYWLPDLEMQVCVSNLVCYSQ